MKRNTFAVTVLCVGLVFWSFSAMVTAGEDEAIEIMVKSSNPGSDTTEDVCKKVREAIDSYKHLKACKPPKDGLSPDKAYPYVFMVHAEKKDGKIVFTLKFLATNPPRMLYQKYFELDSLDDVAGKVEKAMEGIMKSCPELKAKDEDESKKEEEKEEKKEEKEKK